MKKLIKYAVIATVALSCVISLTSCGNGVEDKKSDRAERQVAAAQQTYSSFYNKNGFFSEGQQSAHVTANAVALTDGGEETATFSDVRDRLAQYKVNLGIMQKEVPSYVADIFAYCQVQSSILKEFGEESLTDVYKLTYDTVDWSSDTTGFGDWVKNTKLLSAAFAGADLESGRIYCTQSHVSNNIKVIANVEYFYNSDSDMGVTTLNWREGGRFEYHYCSAGSYEILRTTGNYIDDGTIEILTFDYMRSEGQMSSMTCSEADEKFVLDYIKSEVSRINGKIVELQEQNERKRTLDGTETTEGEHVKSCPVTLDFAILKKMLNK